MTQLDEILWPLYRGGNANAAIIWYGGDGLPLPLTGYSVEIFGQDKALTPQVLSAQIADEEAGRVIVHFAYADNLPGILRFRLRIVAPDGEPTALPPWRIELT